MRGGLSASSVGRLKAVWSEEHARWSKRDLSAKRYVYFWADGIHVQARLEDAAACLLVIIGATPEGASRPYRRCARECAILEGTAARPEATRTCEGPQARGRRRRARLLAGDRGSVAADPR